jgi:hypothetical protein
MTVWGGVVKLFLTVEVLFGQLCKGLAADTGVSGLGTSTCLVLIECEFLFESLEDLWYSGEVGGRSY